MMHSSPEIAGPAFIDRKLREALRTALTFRIRLLEIEIGVERRYPDGTIVGSRFPGGFPLIGPKLYEGDAFDGFVIYDDYRESDRQGVTTRSVATDGNQADARDLEPREVALGTCERARGVGIEEF